MVLDEVGAPLRLRELPDPLPGAGQLRFRVEAAVCVAPICTWSTAKRRLVSVANLTRRDGRDFLAPAARTPIATTTRYRLESANDALQDLRTGRLVGAAVLVP